MTLSIDLDRTWTADPAAWGIWYQMFTNWGHRIIMATGRQRYSDDMDRFNIPSDMTIIYCGGTPKRQACLALGIEVDVWIDDMPAMIDGTLKLINDDEL